MADENAVKEAVDEVVDQIALADEFDAVLGEHPPNAAEDLEISKEQENEILGEKNDEADDVEMKESVEKEAEKQEEPSKPEVPGEAENLDAPKNDVEPRKEPEENALEANIEPMEVVEARNETAPAKEAEPKPAENAEERPPEVEVQQNADGDAAPAPPPMPNAAPVVVPNAAPVVVPNAAPVVAVPPPPAVHNLPPLQQRNVTEADLLHSEQMPDIERNERWRSMRPYTYPKRDEGPPQAHRKSLLQLLDAVAIELGQPLDDLLGTPEGRMTVNEYIKGETAYVPKMLHHVTIDHLAGQDAHAYRLRPSRGKPPFNATESSLAVIFERKSMPLRFPGAERHRDLLRLLACRAHLPERVRSAEEELEESRGLAFRTLRPQTWPPGRLPLPEMRFLQQAWTSLLNIEPLRLQQRN